MFLLNTTFESTSHLGGQPWGIQLCWFQNWFSCVLMFILLILRDWLPLVNSKIKSESTALDNKNMKDYQEILFPVFSITLAKRKCVLSLLSGVSLLPYGLWSLRLLCPRDFPGKNTGVGCHFLLQGILPTQGSSLCLLWLLHWQADSLPLSHLGSPLAKAYTCNWHEVSIFCFVLKGQYCEN